VSDLSVIIPTRDGEQTIGELLRRLRRQQGIGVPEILVMDSGSRDRTPAIARELGARIEQVPPDRFDHGSTRTRAAELARGEILVYLTQDALPADDQCLARLTAPLRQREEVAASYGRQVARADSSLFAKHLRWFNYGEISGIRGKEDREQLGFRTVFISNSCAAWRRGPLAAAGYFGRDQIFGEDSCALGRLLLLGYRVAYVAEARVIHAHDYSLVQEFRRYFDVGVFHRREQWLRDEFGTASGAGRAYVISEMKRIIAEKRYLLLPVSVARNLMKLLGYRTGLLHQRLPAGLCARLSMNPGWWARCGQGTRRGEE